MATIRIESLRIYPIKSCRGLQLSSAPVGRRGLQGDREWMLVDPEGDFLSQRTHPRMALIAPRILEDGGLEVEAPHMPALEIVSPHGDPAGPGGRQVTIWGDRCPALDAGDDAAEWFSRFLGRPCRLVRQDPQAERPVSDPAGAGPENQLSFADGFPFLLTSRASLADLNRRMERSLPMDRFRPNLVVAGSEPWAEDRWDRIRIGPVEFRAAKPCARCVVTTVDQETGRTGSEPLRTLGRFRRGAGGVLFGQNLVHRSAGELRVGDRVRVETLKRPLKE